MNQEQSDKYMKLFYITDKAESDYLKIRDARSNGEPYSEIELQKAYEHLMKSREAQSDFLKQISKEEVK